MSKKPNYTDGWDNTDGVGFINLEDKRRFDDPPIDEGACIIVMDKVEKSRWYTSQSGGYSCKHPTAFGYLYRFSKEAARSIDTKLMEYFMSERWGGWCTGFPGKLIEEEDCEYIEKVLKKYTGNTCWKVNRVLSAREHSMEAWVYLVNECTKKMGVLVWNNSD